jgi:hypothetical protein
MAVSIVALFVALGGTGYAALSLPKNSVGTQQIRNRSISTAKLKNRAVTKAKLNLSGVTVPAARRATTASSATNAGHAATADNATTAAHASSADTAATAQALTAPEPVRLVGAAGEPGFQNSWINHGGSADEPAGFYKDQEGIVHLQGQVVDGSGAIFQLPPGDRPDSGKILRVPAASCDCLKSVTDSHGDMLFEVVLAATVTIDGSGFGSTFDGAVNLDSNSYLPSGNALSLDGISFRAGS